MRRLLASVRTRLLAMYVGLLAVAVVASFGIARELLLDQLNERIDRELVQETEELRRLAAGNDPETGEPFAGSVRRVLEVFFSRNIPSRNEILLTFVDGRPFLRSPPDETADLDWDSDLFRRWASLESAERGRAGTAAGPIEYLAVPLSSQSGVPAVFVVGIYSERERAEYDAAIRAVGGVALAMLLIGTLLFWRLADGVLRPVRLVTGTARSISESDLSRRIEVEGEDEVGQLAQTFNDMLGRLERAFSAQREFLDDAGHELRTPLTIVRGHLEVLGDDPLERVQTIALVMDELDRMSRIVNDLLLLAKAEQPDFLELTTVDVTSLTVQVHANSRALAARDWKVESCGRGMIVADGQRLAQALVQLAQNAVQHTAEGDPIWIGSAVENGVARLWIRDSGPGVPAEEHGRIFERFGRGVARRRGDGAGLGLAIVETIARAHGGHVELDSDAGAGAVFTLVVPVDQPHPDEQGAG